MEAEVGGMWPQAKEYRSHQKLEEARNGFFPRASGRSIALSVLDFKLPDSGTVKEYVSVVLNYQPSGDLYSSHRKLR